MKNSICDTEIFHSRTKPFKNFFKYKVLYFLINIKKINELRKFLILSINRWNILSIYNKDYGIDAPSSNLYEKINKLLDKINANLKNPDIFLLTCPRFFGYAFNPISIYFVYENNKIKFIMYEVRNTHHEKHIYIKKIRKHHVDFKHTIQKQFYVSPFLKMKMKYDFVVNIKNKILNIKINAHNKKETLLTGMKVDLLEFNLKNLFSLLLKRIFFSQKVMLMIHYQAVKILLKKAKFYFKKKNLVSSYSYHE